MIIFDTEKLDGLESQLSDRYSHASAVAAIVPDVIAKAADLYKNPDTEYHKETLQKDLMIVNGILVTTNWNLNDDIFTPLEVASSIHTPLFKPANIGHMGKEIDKKQEIIGVIYQSQPVNDEYQIVIPSSTDRYHILISIYLWEKYFPNKSKEIKDAIDRNEMSLSMECLFDNFGYGLKKISDDSVSLLPRNQATSWLTKHLRAYGGKGTVKINGETFRVGRWIKAPIFSGVGFVETPGNPESIIFKDYISHANLNKNYKIVDEETSQNWALDKKFDQGNDNCVLLHREGIDLWPQ